MVVESDLCAELVEAQCHAADEVFYAMFFAEVFQCGCDFGVVGVIEVVAPELVGSVPSQCNSANAHEFPPYAWWNESLRTTCAP